VAYFETDSSEIMPETHQTLETLAGEVRMSRNVLVRLDGHSGGGAKNQSLALRRAIAVRNMIAQMGVPPDRITVDNEAHADTMLSRQKSEKGGNMQDCRVDIFLELPSGMGT
jgi:outer membrane protein OmpA-like peptidoglycan-associated protein